MEPKFWDDSLAGSGVDSTIITMKNISVLTEYVKKKIGKDATIMLAEQAFNSTQGEELQAATYAYAYYISEGNKMIESLSMREIPNRSRMWIRAFTGDFAISMAESVKYIIHLK